MARPYAYLLRMDDSAPPPDISRLSAPALLRAVLHAYGWSQERLAKEVERHPRSIADWLHGRSEPRLSDAQRLRDLLERAPSPVEVALRETEGG